MKEKINKFGEMAFFAAANSGYGFYSFYDDIFSNPEILRKYIIKGGPGTGKSRFMREVGKAAETVGYDVEYYYCSSDPTSLDGVIVENRDGGRMCVVDGTSPHLCDTDIPGARDEIINLCEFWNSVRLAAQRERIEEINRKKKKAYERADAALRAIRTVAESVERDTRSAVKYEKIDSASRKLIRETDVSGEYFERIGLQGSLGMFGSYTLDTYLSVCDDIIIVDDYLSLASVYLSSLLSHLRRFGISSYRSYDVQDPKKLDALYIPSLSLSIISDASGICASEGKCRKRINMQRFVEVSEQKRLRSEMKGMEKAIKELRYIAENEMQKMREAHFELENIYIGAMDFDAKEAFSAKWIEENL